jgi:hypothetical protein
MKKYRGVEVYLHAFFASALDVDGQLQPRGNIPFGTHLIGGWVGPRAGLDAVEKRDLSVGRWSLFISLESSVNIDFKMF